MESLVSNISTILIMVAVLCTIVSVITQFTKEWGFLNKIPTSLQVLIISIVLTVVAFFSIVSYKSWTVQWYMIFGSVIMGILIAYITMHSWNELVSLFKRFYKSKDDLK